MAKQYKMIRVSEEVAEMLWYMRNRFQEDNSQGRTEHPFDERSGLPTYETVIRVLIEREWRHRQANKPADKRISLAEALADSQGPQGNQDG